MTDTNNALSDPFLKDGFSLRAPVLSIVAFDPSAEGDDFPTCVLVDREEWQRGETVDPNFAVQRRYRVKLVNRMDRTLEFPEQQAALMRLHRWLNHRQAKGLCYQHFLVIETNGVGWPIASDLRLKLGSVVVPMATTGSGSNSPQGARGSVAMPRMAGLDNLRYLMEMHALKIDRDAPGGHILQTEMQSFVWAGKRKPQALSGQHDDSILPLASACWLGQKVVPPYLKQKVPKKPKVSKRRAA